MPIKGKDGATERGFRKIEGKRVLRKNKRETCSS